MGGNAFNASHPEASFPRMQSAVYEAAKSKLHTALRALYDHVITPHETPQKTDHGDIDFVVCLPKPDLTHDQVKEALGAIWSIPAKGTSNFALPWDTAVGRDPEDDVVDKQHYIQVDVCVCEDLNAYDRVVFCHSYGDLAMILGLMARSIGLSLGTNGLRLVNPLPTSPPIPLHLCASFPRILSFFELSMERWQEGFFTQHEVFAWISASRFYNPTVMARLEADNQGGRRIREARGMYQNFLIYARENTIRDSGLKVLGGGTMDAALHFFGKWELHRRILHVAAIKEHIKKAFTGKLVSEWTDVRGVPVRWIMEEMKKRLGGELPDETPPGVQEAITDSAVGEPIDAMHWTLSAWQIGVGQMTVGELRDFVVQVKTEMSKEGKLVFDWKEAKRQKAERQRALALEAHINTPGGGTVSPY